MLSKLSFMIKKICFAVLLLSGLVACKSKTAFDYSQNFVKREQSLQPDIEKTESQVEAFAAKQEFDSIGAAGERMEKLVDAKLKEVKDEPAPDVKLGAEFKAAGIKYFEFIRDLYTSYKEYGYAKTPEERQSRMEKIQSMAGQKDKAIGDIQSVQKRYAEANDLKMEK